MPGWKPITPVQAFQGFQLLRQGGILLTSILLAKSVLSTAEIGVYEQLMFVQYALSFFWITGMIQGLLTFFPHVGAKEQPGFVFSVYLVLLATTVLVLLALVGARPLVLSVLTGKSALDYLWLLVFHLLLNLPSFLLEYFFLLKERARAILWFGFLSFVGGTLVVAAPVLAGYSLEYSFWGLIGLGLVKHLWLLVEIGGFRGGIRWEGELVRRWLILASPLILYAFIGGLVQTYNGWLVNWWFAGDETQFALFRYGARELPLTIALSEALNAALIPLAAKDQESALEQTRTRTTFLMHLIFPLTILLVLSSRWWFSLVFSPEFSASVPVLNVFLLITVSRLVFPRALLIALQDNRAVLGISLAEIFLLAVLGMVFVSFWGIQGVALATCLAFLSEKVLQILRLYRKFGISPGAYIPLGWWAGYSTLLLGAYLWTLL